MTEMIPQNEESSITASEPEKDVGGAPTKYDKKFNDQVYKLCLLGATDKEIADFFGVCEATINNWKIEYPKFLESIKSGKTQADAEIAQKLYHRAKGYEHKATKFATFNGSITDREEYIEHYPPDTQAIMFWLKNRQPEKWREKQEIEHTNPIVIQISPDEARV